MLVSSPSSSLPSSSDSSAPIALGLESPKEAGAFGDAKLLRPADFPAAPNPPPTPANPPPSAPNPDVPAADAKLEESPAGLKTEGFDAPSALNGEVSEPAKADKLDEANIEGDVVFSAFSSVDGFPIDAKGEAAVAFPNALAAKPYDIVRKSDDLIA